jgi:hypothetical protein
VVLIHLLLDTFDWGVMVAWPLSERTRGLKILANEVEGKKLSTAGYLRVYLGHKVFMTGEAILAITALGLMVSIV